jgi:hypothetical protein
MRVMPTVPMMEKMHDRTSKYQEERKYPKEMCAVFRQKKKCGDSEEANEHPFATIFLRLDRTSFWCVIHRWLLCLTGDEQAIAQQPGRGVEQDARRHHLHCSIIAMCFFIISGGIDFMRSFIIDFCSSDVFPLIIFLCMSHIAFISFMSIIAISSLGAPCDIIPAGCVVEVSGWFPLCAASWLVAQPVIAIAATIAAKQVANLNFDFIEKLLSGGLKRQQTVLTKNSL